MGSGRLGAGCGINGHHWVGQPADRGDHPGRYRRGAGQRYCSAWHRTGHSVGFRDGADRRPGGAVDRFHRPDCSGVCADQRIGQPAAWQRHPGCIWCGGYCAHHRKCRSADWRDHAVVDRLCDRQRTVGSGNRPRCAVRFRPRRHHWVRIATAGRGAVVGSRIDPPARISVAAAWRHHTAGIRDVRSARICLPAHPVQALISTAQHITHQPAAIRRLDV